MTLFRPDELTSGHMLHFGSQTYGPDLLITGVPTNSKGKLVWNSVDDVVMNPDVHGLMSCLETISHVHQWVSMTAEKFSKPFPRLNIRFVATIEEAFDGSEATMNPAAWVHLGHGMLEHTYELLEDLEEWDDEEFEAIPGLSNGYEDKDYVSVKDLRNRISQQQGNILFMALPLCFAEQIAEFLCQHDRIHMASVSTNFPVTESLQFYDGYDNKARLEHSLHSWSAWVKAVEDGWRCRHQPVEPAIQMPIETAPAPPVMATAPPPPAQPMTVADYTGLPPGGSYDQSTGQTIYVQPDGTRWQMMGDGSFNRLN